MKLCVSWDESVCITGFVCTHTLQARCGTFLTNETGLTKVVELERRILETVNFRRKSADFGWLPLIDGGLDARS